MPSNFQQSGTNLESYLIENIYSSYVPAAYRKSGGPWGNWGTVWSFGSNNNGQLGQGNTTNYSSPVQVGSLTTWKLVSGGQYFTTAIKTDGTLWAWGQNIFYGQLGQGDRTNYSSPVQVGSLTNWKEVSNGRYHSVAIKTDGTLWAWGSNAYGQLGQYNTTHYSSSTSRKFNYLE